MRVRRRKKAFYFQARLDLPAKIHKFLTVHPLAIIFFLTKTLALTTEHFY